jgi:hypothetical protein
MSGKMGPRSNSPGTGDSDAQAHDELDGQQVSREAGGKRRLGRHAPIIILTSGKSIFFN